MRYRINPSRLSGEAFVPPSKSHTLRALLFGLMGQGKTTIHNPLPSPDTNAMIEAIRLLGGQVKVGSSLEVMGGTLQPAQNVIDAGNSGQVLRFVAALSALLPTYTILTGDLSVRQRRPVQPLLSALSQLGAFAVSSTLNDHPPVIIKGPIAPGRACLSGEDSQPVSALLIATSFLPGPSEILVDNPGETPWIELTLSWLKKRGINVERDQFKKYYIPGNATYSGFETTIPGDFSSASYLEAAARITRSPLVLQGLDWDDCQGDKQVFSLLEQGGEIDVNPVIDALPLLAACACFGQQETRLANGLIARKKESDRISAIATELKKMGARIEEKEDGLVIQPSTLKGAHLSSHADHRIALSLTVAALGAQGETLIDGVECIAKSFPHFATLLQSLGASLEELP